MHSGHVAMFKEASTFGDLIVALNSDDWLERKKGKAFMSLDERKAIVSELKCVSEVIDFNDNDGTAINAIQKVFVANPNSHIIFANGGDRTQTNIPELAECKNLGVDVVFGIGGEDKKQSSSSLLSNWKTNQTDRKWGYFSSLHNGGKVRVKQLVIEPYMSISLQYHYHRAEHWFIESGVALVERGNEQIELTAGEHVHIDVMQLHRITNITVPRQKLKLVEVQVGDILDEQDIVRVEEKRP